MSVIVTNTVPAFVSLSTARNRKLQRHRQRLESLLCWPWLCDCVSAWKTSYTPVGPFQDLANTLCPYCFPSYL